MGSFDIKDKISISSDQLAAINREDGTASGLPNIAYTDPEFLELERKELFSKTWTCVANACSVPNPGDLKPIRFLGIPLIIVRGKEGQIRVFHNVCSHRGNELVWEACNVPGMIRCPYHSWSYDLDGNLKGTPHVGGPDVHEVNGFDKSGYGLKAVRSAMWMDLVFVNVSGDAPSFPDFIGPLQKRIDALAPLSQFDQLKPAANFGTFTIEFAGNWKLCVENNLESYHLPWVHPDLNSVSRLEDHYHFYGGDLFAGQGSKEYDHTKVNPVPIPMLKNWPEKVAEYPTLYPNVFLGLQCDHFWTRIVEPVTCDRSLDHLQIYYLGDASDDAGLEQARKVRLDTWIKVFKEDIGVVEGMQRGRQSPAFDGGVFTKIMDEPSHHFAKWVANSLFGR